MPVIIGKLEPSYSRSLSISKCIKEQSTTDILSTVHILWEVLTQKNKIFNLRVTTLCLPWIVTTRELQHYIIYPRSIVCFRCTIVNSLYKWNNHDFDDEDDDDDDMQITETRSTLDSFTQQLYMEQRIIFFRQNIWRYICHFEAQNPWRVLCIDLVIPTGITSLTLQEVNFRL